MLGGFTSSPIGCLTVGIDGWTIGGTPLIYQFLAVTSFAVTIGSDTCGINSLCYDGITDVMVAIDSGTANMNVGSVT